MDPSAVIPSTVPGHSAPIFGRMAGSSFQATISSVNAPFGIGSGPELHPITTFPGDSYGGSAISERPKKVLLFIVIYVLSFNCKIIAYTLVLWIHFRHPFLTG